MALRRSLESDADAPIGQSERKAGTPAQQSAPARRPGAIQEEQDATAIVACRPSMSGRAYRPPAPEVYCLHPPRGSRATLTDSDGHASAGTKPVYPLTFLPDQSTGAAHLVVKTLKGYRMTDLPVPVVVDPNSGIWSVDGQPMVLIPRHFWVFVQMEIEKQAGVDMAQRLLHDATARAARLWCEREAETHGLSGVDVFRHYMKRVSARGMGQFTIESIEPESGSATIRLEHSPYVAEYGAAGRNVCYTFNGALVGGMEYVATAAGRQLSLNSREVTCAANGAEHCRFSVSSQS